MTFNDFFHNVSCDLMCQYDGFLPLDNSRKITNTIIFFDPDEWLITCYIIDFIFDQINVSN